MKILETCREKLNRKSLAEYACLALIVTAMLTAAAYWNEREIIFPEIAALSIGFFLSRKFVWKTDYLRTLLFIMVCAVLGVAIVLFLPFSLWIQLCIAYIAGQLVYMFSRTTLAPMISAIVLPVLLQTRSVIYLLSALILTAVILLLRLLLEKAEIKKKIEYQKSEMPAKKDWMKFVYRTISVCIMMGVCLKVDARFAVAPPLLVAYTELCNEGCRAVTKIHRALALVICCAASGAAIRILMMQFAGMPSVASAALSGLAVSLAIILLSNLFDLHFPPSGAMAVLAFLIPESYVLSYPVCVAAGIVILGLSAWGCRRMQQKLS